MKITENQLRTIVRRIIREQTMSRGYSRAADRAAGANTEVDEAAVRAAALDATEEGEQLRLQHSDPQDSHSYDKYILKAVSSFLPYDKQEKNAFMLALIKMLEERMNGDDWFDGAHVAWRAISLWQRTQPR